MDVRNSSDIPRVTGEGTCEETACLTDEMGDDLSDNSQGKPGGRGQAGCGNLGRSNDTLPAAGQTSVPNSLDN